MNATRPKPRGDRFAPKSLSPSGFDPAIGRAVRAGDALIEALIALAGGRGDLLMHSEQSWASVTFKGARHQVVLQFEGLPAVLRGEQLIDGLPEHEFAIPGWLVADAAVVAESRRQGYKPMLTVTCELLLIEDDPDRPIASLHEDGN